MAVALFVLGGATSIREARAAERVVDAAIVRYVSLETGGIARPRFVTERTLRFLTALEVKLDKAERSENRHMQAAVERWIAEDMLSSLFLRRYPDPPNLATMVGTMEAELDARLAPQTSRDLLEAHGLTVSDLGRILYKRARATLYADENVATITHDAEDDVRDAFRTMTHPFRGSTFDSKQEEFKNWLIHERLRRVELEYLETARTRVRVTWISGGHSS